MKFDFRGHRGRDADKAEDVSSPETVKSADTEAWGLLIELSRRRLRQSIQMQTRGVARFAQPKRLSAGVHIEPDTT